MHEARGAVHPLILLSVCHYIPAGRNPPDGGRRRSRLRVREEVTLPHGIWRVIYRLCLNAESGTKIGRNIPQILREPTHYRRLSRDDRAGQAAELESEVRQAGKISEPMMKGVCGKALYL